MKLRENMQPREIKKVMMPPMWSDMSSAQPAAATASAADSVRYTFCKCS